MEEKGVCSSSGFASKRAPVLGEGSWPDMQCWGRGQIQGVAGALAQGLRSVWLERPWGCRPCLVGPGHRDIPFPAPAGGCKESALQGCGPYLGAGGGWLIS